MMDVFDFRAFPVGCFGSHFQILFDWKINRSLNTTWKMAEKATFVNINNQNYCIQFFALDFSDTE